jgi:hypothetical protein
LVFASVCSILSKNSYALSTNESQAATTNIVDDAYSGIIGTGIRHETITAAGPAIEFTPAGMNYYLFFTQTLSNGIYYEARLYARNNYDAQSPIFPSVPVSNENNPWGYGGSFRFGYDFQPNANVDIIPFLRLDALYDMSAVYADTNGDYINSTTYGIMPGIKVACRVNTMFNPYISLYGGWNAINLNGAFPASGIGGTASGYVNQEVMFYEIGFSSKLSENISMIPYFIYATSSNNPDATAANSYNNGGFNINSLTDTQQIFGLKLSINW